MFTPIRNSGFLFWMIGTFSLSHSQTRTEPVFMPACPECSSAAQTPDSRPGGPPQVQFLQAPKPRQFPLQQARPPLEIHFELTARIVSMQPFALDVLGVSGQMSKFDADNLCGSISVVSFADAKLKDALAQLRLNQVVKAKLFAGENDVVLSEVDASPSRNAGNCSNQSGLLISYRAKNGFLSVYNDGAIFYQDRQANRFDSEKLTHDELVELLKTFADNGFDIVPSSTPPRGTVDQNSLTLICSRLQRVSLAGQETKLAALLLRLEDLKSRATSKAYYLLLTSGKKKLTILEWPFTQIRLSQVETMQRYGPNVPPVAHAPVPEDFLSKLPKFMIIGDSMPNPNAYVDPNAYVFVSDAGDLYRVSRGGCAPNSPMCKTFLSLTAARIQQPATILHDQPQVGGRGIYSPAGLFWPSDLGIDIARVGQEGHAITNDEYEQHQPFYFKLHELSSTGFGYSFIDHGYIYQGVRICRVDPRAPATSCTNPDDKRH
jgi:hypothetical protein